MLEEGAYYSNAHYQHSNTETIVGHAVLATGAFPSTSGMVANVWLDRESGKLAYNIEDDRYRTLSSEPFVDKKTEIDPTQKAAQTDGRSPKAILTSTFSDELFVSTGGRSKIFGVSIKDRGAVSLAGHAGKAFWFSKKTGENLCDLKNVRMGCQTKMRLHRHPESLSRKWRQARFAMA